MWFLIKSTVFICLTLVTLSFFGTQEDGKSNLSVSGMTDAVLSAGEIVHYMSGICIEKPDVCVKGAETLSMLSERTRDGAKVALQLLEGQLGDTGSKTTDPKPVIPSTVELAKSQPASDEMADTIQTGTIAKPELPLNELRIPVPLKRPAGY